MPVNNPPAFPHDVPREEMHTYRIEQGMSLLDYFAGQALVGVLNDDKFMTAVHIISEQRKMLDTEIIARFCYEQAQAMLAERQRLQGEEGSKSILSTPFRQDITNEPSHEGNT